LANSGQLQQIAPMKTRLFFVVAGIFAAAGVHAQSLQLLNANYPGILCRFSPDCHVTPTSDSSSFDITNFAATCVLESRSFLGNGMDAHGVYGYEYRVILNNHGERGTNYLTVDSLTLNFDSLQSFAFGQHASNQVWIVTSGGPGSVAPGAAEMTESNVVVQFNPPLVLATLTNNSVSTYFFGMASKNRPQVTTAILSGSTQTPPDDAIPFKAEMEARTP
jgi:hypothetical protein